MLRPDEKGYNIEYEYATMEKEKMIISLTIDELIEELQEAKKHLGGNTIVMTSYDGGAGYEEIRSIHGQNFHDNLICVLSCDCDPEDRKICEYCHRNIPDPNINE